MHCIYVLIFALMPKGNGGLCECFLFFSYLFFFCKRLFWYSISMDVPKELQHVNLETYPCICQLHRRKNCRGYICLWPYFRNNMPPLVFFILHFEGQVCVLLATLLRYSSSISGLLLRWPDIELVSGPIFAAL